MQEIMDFQSMVQKKTDSNWTECAESTILLNWAQYFWELCGLSAVTPGVCRHASGAYARLAEGVKGCLSLPFPVMSWDLAQAAPCLTPCWDRPEPPWDLVREKQ